jgi:hypothetical protein
MMRFGHELPYLRNVQEAPFDLAKAAPETAFRPLPTTRPFLPA